ENKKTTQIAFDFVKKSKLVVVESEDETKEPEETTEEQAVETVAEDVGVAADPPLETGEDD
ncbi:MAG: hypothetical protein GXO75_17320, partial [Calditrichaeota bacterium]|nr:hypothetical protein [Calditrichota bacterium]